MSETHKTWSKMCAEGSTALLFHCLSSVALPDQELRERQVGHGVLLKEKGFYPIGHKQGIVVLSYYDEIQQAIIYEKLLFKEAIPRQRVELEAKRIGEGKRAFYFE